MLCIFNYNFFFNFCIRFVHTKVKRAFRSRSTQRLVPAASLAPPNVMHTSCESNWKEQIAHVFFMDSVRCVCERSFLRFKCVCVNCVSGEKWCRTRRHQWTGVWRQCASVCTQGKIDSTNSLTFIYLNSKRKQNKIEEIVLLPLLPSNNCKCWKRAKPLVHTHRHKLHTTEKRPGPQLRADDESCVHVAGAFSSGGKHPIASQEQAQLMRRTAWSEKIEWKKNVCGKAQKRWTHFFSSWTSFFSF